MKTATLTYPKHLTRQIDLAPLDVRYRLLMASIMALIEAGKMARVVKLTAKLNRLVRCYVKLHTHNEHLTLKLDMLLDKPWRERVLKELGGMSRLKLWEAAKARIEERRKAPPKPARKAEPSWLYTPERIAESERLKAYARKCGKATAHPRVFREPVRVDYDGLFRLAPLPRGERAPRQVVVYTANTISDYDWNNMLIAEPKGFGPAPVWPAEFYAAAEAEREVRDERETQRGYFLNDEEDVNGRIRRETRRLWVQTEVIKAHLTMAENGVAGSADMAAAFIDGLFETYLKPDGTWCDQTNACGGEIATTIPVSTFYHIACMAFEAERVSELSRL